MVHNYAVYGLLSSSTQQTIQQFIDQHLVQLQASKQITIPKELPHVTILYGPALSDNTSEITDAERVEEVYPEIRSLVQHPYKLVYRGVSHFKSINRYIIKLEFECQALTDLQVQLRQRLPQVNQIYLDEESTRGTLSKALPPVRWIHVTLCFVEIHNDTMSKDLEKVLDIEEKARQYFKDFPVEIILENIAVMSAVSDTPLVVS